MAPDDNIHEMASPSPYSDEKSGFDGDEIEVSKPVGALTQSVQEKGATPEMRARIAEYYGAKAEEDEIAPRADITAIVDRIMEMTNEEAVDILTKTIHAHRVSCTTFSNEVAPAPRACVHLPWLRDG